MPSILNSDNGAVSGSAGLKFDAADDGILEIQNSGNTAITVASSGQATFTHAVSQPGAFMFRNKIINGDMRIDQRNAGSSVTLTAGGIYTVDRWIGYEDTDGAMTAQQDSSVPTGFINSVKCTTTTADASLSGTQFSYFSQRIEGFNVADLAWGTASAKPITISFWVRSSLTGTFGGALNNSNGTRSYPFTYTISSANTWEQKTITVDGDTTGTWLTDNNTGIGLIFGLGVGSTYSGTAGAWAGANYASATGATSVISTLNATWYITGVQLETGSVATPFEQRPIGLELSLCTRYFYRMRNGVNNFYRFALGDVRLSTEINGVFVLPNIMRGTRSLTISSASHFAVAEANVNRTVTGIGIAETPLNSNWVFYTATVSSGLTAGRCAQLISNSTTASYLDFSAEL